MCERICLQGIGESVTKMAGIQLQKFRQSRQSFDLKEFVLSLAFRGNVDPTRQSYDWLNYSSANLEVTENWDMREFLCLLNSGWWTPCPGSRSWCPWPRVSNVGGCAAGGDGLCENGSGGRGTRALKCGNLLLSSNSNIAELDFFQSERSLS